MSNLDWQDSRLTFPRSEPVRVQLEHTYLPTVYIYSPIKDVKRSINRWLNGWRDMAYSILPAHGPVPAVTSRGRL